MDGWMDGKEKAQKSERAGQTIAIARGKRKERGWWFSFRYRSKGVDLRGWGFMYCTSDVCMYVLCRVEFGTV